MAFNSAHTGAEIDAAVQMMGQIQDARDSTKDDLVEVRVLAAQVDANAAQVGTQSASVATKSEQVAANALAVEQAREQVAADSAVAEGAKDSAAASAEFAEASRLSANASQQAASQSQIAAGISEQVSAEHAANAESTLLQISTLRDQVEADSGNARSDAESAAVSAEVAAELVDGYGYLHYDNYAAMNNAPQIRNAIIAVVDNDPVSSRNGWYSWDLPSKTWSRLVRQPSWELTDLVRSVAPNDSKPAVAFTDDYGMVLAKWMADGSLDMRGGVILGRGEGGLSIVDNNGFSLARFDGLLSEFSGLSVKSYPRRNGTFFVDDLGFVLAKVANDGVFFGAKSKAEAPAVVAVPVAQLGQQVRTGIMQIVGDGQSLSVGETALPAISKTQPFFNVMMASGVKSRYQQMGYNPALVPLVEQDGVAPFPVNQGETPVSGMANGLVRRISQRGQTPADWCFAAMAAGRAGWSVERLSPPPLGIAGVWEDMVNMVADMKAQADLAGKTYSVWAYQWAQGESNYLSQWVNSQYQYTQYLAQLWDKFTEKVLGITGQSFRPYMFTYQVAAHRWYSSDWMDIALSQWALSKNRPDVVMAVPCYQFGCSADHLHLTNEQSWLLGEYFGRAMDFTMVRKSGKWRPLEPVSVNWQSDTIDIKYHVPGGRVVIDTALCAQARNQGFDVRDINDTVIDGAIESVAVTAFDTVRIKLVSAAVSQSFRITYARGVPGDPVASGALTGARGNVRDTMGEFDKVTSPLGNEFALHNASVMYQFDKKNGFF